MRFDTAAPGEFANARITIGATNCVGDIGPMFDTARTKLRNIIDQRRAAQTVWHDVEVLGWMRVADAADPLAQKPTWTISADLMVRHGAWQEVGHLLAEGWKSPGQTAVTPFDPEMLIQESLGESIQRALAPWHPNFDAEDAWPKERVGELYEYVSLWSRGFESLRIAIGQRDAKRTRHSRGAQDDTAMWLEPMPVIVTEDRFSTISYPWNF